MQHVKIYFKRREGIDTKLTTPVQEEKTDPADRKKKIQNYLKILKHIYRLYRKYRP